MKAQRSKTSMISLLTKARNDWGRRNSADRDIQSWHAKKEKRYYMRIKRNMYDAVQMTTAQRS